MLLTGKLQFSYQPNSLGKQRRILFGKILDKGYKMIFTNPVDDLASQINQRGGLAKPNYFAVTFTGPAAVSPNQFLINALCESVTIPGRSIATTEHGTTRQATKRPY